MQRSQQILLGSVGWILASCACGPLEDLTDATGFPGVTGQIFQLDTDGCPGLADGEEQYPDEQAWVKAFANQAEAGKADTDSEGKFTMPLAPGTYDITVYPSQYHIDDSLKGVQISRETGIRMRRSYDALFHPQYLSIVFYASVSLERLWEILQENELRMLSSFYGNLSIIDSVEVPYGTHPEEMKSHLEQSYEEVESTDLEPWECAPPVTCSVAYLRSK